MAEQDGFSVAEAQSRVGRTLNGKWHLDALIAVGGMASVYAATHRNGRRAAVKILHPIFPEETRIRERFLREGYLANKVDHPGAVAVLDDDVTEDGTVFLVMELLSGLSVDTLLVRSGGVLPVLPVLAIAEQTLDVLATAHDRGIVHRDIKPGNLYLTWERRVKVLDFGLARPVDPGPQGGLTADGVVLGTMAYLAPEMAGAKGMSADGRTDLYALGAVMFRSLSGRYVFEGRTPSERLLQLMSQQPPSLASVSPQIPRNVVRLVDKALAPDRNDRWPDARTMQKAVRNALAVETEGRWPAADERAADAVPVSPPSPPPAAAAADEEPIDLPSEFVKSLPEITVLALEEALSRSGVAPPPESADPSGAKNE